MIKSLLIVSVTMFSALTSFAARGPSVSGGTSEAPWVRTQDVTSQVVDYANKNSLPIKSIQFNRNQSKVLLKVSCSNGRTGEVLFNIIDDCRQTPVMCMPFRTLEVEATKACN